MRKISKKSIDRSRKIWIEVAKTHGWYSEPFYIQIWVGKLGTIQDSVAYKGLKGDIILSCKKEIVLIEGEDFELV